MERLKFENAAAILRKATKCKALNQENGKYVTHFTCHEYVVAAIMDDIEDFKKTFPEIFNFIDIDILDDNTTDFVNAVKSKIILTFKENVDQYVLKALLKIKGIL